MAQFSWKRIASCFGAIAGLLLASLPIRAALASDYVVVVSSSNAVASMTSSDLRDIFLADQKKWKGGVAINPVLPASNSPAIAELLSKVLRMRSEDELSMYYMAAIFQQKITEPPGSGSAEAAIAVVVSDPGGVAFVSRSAAAGNAKIRIINIDGL